MLNQVWVNGNLKLCINWFVETDSGTSFLTLTFLTVMKDK